MDLDTMLAEAAPARRASLDGPDSPAGISLYQRIITAPAAPSSAFRRRRFPVLALAGAAAAAAAATLTVLPTSPALAAWTVTKKPDGLVRVTIHQLRDPVGLERRLRAAGVPASVRFLAHPFTPTTSSSAIPRSCRAPRMSDEANAKLQQQIMPSPLAKVSDRAGGNPGGAASKLATAHSEAVLTIRPSAIPRGIGLYLEAYAMPRAAGNGAFALQTDLVRASPQCTG